MLIFDCVEKKSECMIQHCTRGGGGGGGGKGGKIHHSLTILLSSYYSVPRVLTRDLAIHKTPSCAIG